MGTACTAEIKLIYAIEPSFSRKKGLKACLSSHRYALDPAYLSEGSRVDPMGRAAKKNGISSLFFFPPGNERFFAETDA